MDQQTQMLLHSMKKVRICFCFNMSTSLQDLGRAALLTWTFIYRNDAGGERNKEQLKFNYKEGRKLCRHV